MTQTLIPPTDSLAVCVASRAIPSCRVRQWDLVEFVDSGSLANIYTARPAGTPNDRPAVYALKMLRPCWEENHEAIRLLQREALVGQNASSPHLVPILGAYVLESPRLLVMPWLEGASLATRLAEGRSFAVPEALWLARQAAEALDALHQAGWLHGDVTPGNIHVSSTGHVTLLDFNFARRANEIGSAADRPIMGTCGYLAPEYLASAYRPDIRSDIFSLGAVLFEMLSGRRPYDGKTMAELASQHRQSSPPELTRLAPHVPREAARLVGRMIAKDPVRRPQTPREVVDRLIALEIATFTHRS